MISPIGSGGYSSPIYIQRPDLSEIQDPSVSSSGPEKKAGVKKGIADYQDSFESAQYNQQNAGNVYSLRSNYHLRMIYDAKQAEQSKAFGPDQPGVAPMKPMVDPVTDISLTADLTANMLSMIRV